MTNEFITQKLDQAAAILHSLTGSTGTDELCDEQVQALLVLCTSLVQESRSSLQA